MILYVPNKISKIKAHQNLSSLYLYSNGEGKKKKKNGGHISINKYPLPYKIFLTNSNLF